MKVLINNKEYHFKTGYQNNAKLIEAFNNLTKKVYGFSFESWYQGGYLTEKYIPYTLFDGDLAVSNASANIMDLDILGESKRYIQIGTVMTDENYRGRGLSRYLIEKIMADWHSKCDLIYLFANDTVLEFYPKLGFEVVKEYEYVRSVINSNQNSDFTKLDMNRQEDRELVYNHINNSQSYSSVSSNRNPDLAMFYCLIVLNESVYFSQALDVVTILQTKNNEGHLWGVFGNSQASLEEIINHLPNIDSIVLGFTPENTSDYSIREIAGSDVLFFQKGKKKQFEENKLMFPLLSHA